jgi:hypothetical protein
MAPQFVAANRAVIDNPQTRRLSLCASLSPVRKCVRSNPPAGRRSSESVAPVPIRTHAKVCSSRGGGKWKLRGCPPLALWKNPVEDVTDFVGRVSRAFRRWGHGPFLALLTGTPTTVVTVPLAAVQAGGCPVHCCTRSALASGCRVTTCHRVSEAQRDPSMGRANDVAAVPTGSGHVHRCTASTLRLGSRRSLIGADVHGQTVPCQDRSRDSALLLSEREPHRVAEPQRRATLNPERRLPDVAPNATAVSEQAPDDNRVLVPHRDDLAPDVADCQIGARLGLRLACLRSAQRLRPGDRTSTGPDIGRSVGIGMIAAFCGAGIIARAAAVIIVGAISARAVFLSMLIALLP